MNNEKDPINLTRSNRITCGAMSGFSALYSGGIFGLAIHGIESGNTKEQVLSCGIAVVGALATRTTVELWKTAVNYGDHH